MIGLSPYGNSDYLASLNNGTPCTRENFFLFTCIHTRSQQCPCDYTHQPMPAVTTTESLHSPNTPLAGAVATSVPVFPAPSVSRQEETVPHWLLHKLRGKESRKCHLGVGSLSMLVSATSFASSTHHQWRSCTKHSSTEPNQHSSNTSSCLGPGCH